jgi:acyl phosphate:glycerol-3-phosphate acyltransferase
MLRASADRAARRGAGRVACAQESPPMALGLTVLAVAVAYVLGSIPFGIVVYRPLGKDPRAVGSGRTGGTNVYRAAGMPAALLTVAGDILKGYLAVWLAGRVVPGATYGAWSGWAMALAALASILGHNHSLFLRFRGGAGSTPNIGAALAYDPVVSAIGFAIGAAVLFGVRIASLASLVLSAVLLFGLGWRVVAGVLPPSTLVYAVGQALFVAWALRPNIARLRAGTERRIEFGRRRTSADDPPP